MLQKTLENYCTRKFMEGCKVTMKGNEILLGDIVLSANPNGYTLEIKSKTSLSTVSYLSAETGIAINKLLAAFLTAQDETILINKILELE